MLQLFYVVIWIVTLVSGSALAWFSRDLALRQAAAACLIAYVLTLISARHQLHWAGVSIGVFLVDGALTVVFAYLALSTRTYWSMAAFGFQLAAPALHIAYLLAPDFNKAGYFVGLSATSYLVVISLLAGAAATVRRRAATAPAMSHQG
jgi:hypothetical protein